MFKDDDNKKYDTVTIQTNLRSAYISVAIMTALIVFNYFCALSPYNMELIGIVLATVYLFVYVKFTIICTTLKDVGYKRLWLNLYRTVGLALYLISAVLCMLGIG